MLLKKSILFGFLLLMFSGVAHAQFTTVTGTVTDPNGLPYANATVSAVLTGATGGPWTLNGRPYAGQISNTPANANGTFNMQMGSNTSITPGGSQWLFTVNETGVQPPLGTGPQTFQVAITITGSTQDVSAALTAAAPKLTNFSSTAGNPCTSTALSFQYNNGGAFGCVADLTYVSGTDTILAGSSANLDFSAAASLKAKIAAGYAPTTSGLFGYDSTAHQWVFGSNGSTVSFLTNTVPGPDYVLTSTALNTPVFEQINGGASCGDSTHAISYDITTHRYGCQAITGTFSSPMTTLGDSLIEGAGPAPARVAGPTTPAGLAQSWTSTPSGGLATAQVWAVPGIAVRAVTGTTATDTLATADCSPKRVAYQGSVAVAVTLPTATTLAVPNCVFRIANNTTGAPSDVTVTPTTWTVNGGATMVIHQGETYTFYVDPSGTAWDADGSIAPVNARQPCDIPVGDTSGSAITNGQLGPQSRVCYIPAAATILEMDVNADAGTPNVIVGRNHAGSISNIVSGALATAAAGGIACSNTGGTTGINGATTCSGTLQNTSLAAGDYLELVSGTAGGTAKFFVVHVIYAIN